MKKTSCIKCVFAQPADSKNVCEHGVVQHLLATQNKKLSIIDNYYQIEDYECKMGFSKDTLITNKELVSIEDIKESILNNSIIKVYLILDISDISIENLAKSCKTIDSMSVLPRFISFSLFGPQAQNKAKIDIVRENLQSGIPWKTHVFLDGTEYTEALHSIVSSNKNANGSHFFLIYDINKIQELEEDINEINTICTIEQRDFHVMKKTGYDNSFSGLLMSFTNYFTARRAEENILDAINGTPEIISYQYGS